MRKVVSVLAVSGVILSGWAVVAVRGSEASRLTPLGAESQAAATQPAATRPGDQVVALVFSGGHETDGRDRGRPVVLVAAALGVPTEVFREAFTHVKPASGGREPEPGQVRENKGALMKALAPYGVTNERLDEVSNFYRYPPGRQGIWKNTPATGEAIVREGNVVSVAVTNAGAGYSSKPTVTVPGYPGVVLEASVVLTKELATNGSVREVKVVGP